MNSNSIQNEAVGVLPGRALAPHQQKAYLESIQLLSLHFCQKDILVQTYK